jgi:hypothetical protein
MHPTRPSIFPAPAASSTRRTAAGVKADRRSPAGLGLDPGEDRRTLATAGTANTQATFTQITCIMPMCVRGQCWLRAASAAFSTFAL